MPDLMDDWTFELFGVHIAIHYGAFWTDITNGHTFVITDWTWQPDIGEAAFGPVQIFW